MSTSSINPLGNAPRTHAAKQLETRLWQLFEQGQKQAAMQACQQLNREFPRYAAGWYSASQLALKLQQARPALAAASRAVQLDPEHVGYRLQEASCLLRTGQFEAARPRVLALHKVAMDTAYQHATLALLLSRLDCQEEALQHYQQAVRLEPSRAEHYYNLATVQRFLGRLDAADAALEQALALDPADADAHKLRADLRRCTPGQNHIEALQAALAREPLSPRQEVTLEFALAKELEDLEQWGESFAALARGAGRRRELMRYDVAADVDTMAQLAQVYDEELIGAAAPGHDSDEAIFIVGMPRTGTTLVERILGSHSAVQSLGELNNFALQMMREVAERSENPGALDKQSRVALSAELDFTRLGEAYIDSTRPGRIERPYFVDKMPLNFLYLGLIHQALPRARIIHVQRHPMASCYATYKTLFTDAYPFSYRLEELARYYAAYQRLMQHWETVMPGVIHHVRYEQLVNDFAPTCRALLEYCELPWEERCLSFHRNPEASTTASASQVRQPLYRGSLEQWRHYEDQLAPLRHGLLAEGVSLD